MLLKALRGGMRKSEKLRTQILEIIEKDFS